MAKCDICSKRSVSGNNVSHSEVKTKRIFGANLQKATFLLDGKKVTMILCAKCVKRLRKDKRMKSLASAKKKK